MEGHRIVRECIMTSADMYTKLSFPQVFSSLGYESIFLYIIWCETPSPSKLFIIRASKNGLNSYGSFCLILTISLFWIILIVIHDTTTVSNYGKVTETSNFQGDAHG